jgi:putative acetyltransferase
VPDAPYHDEVHNNETSAHVVIGPEDPALPEIVALLDRSDAYHAALYPAESNHLVSAAQMRTPQTTFLAARLDGRAVGTVAMVAGPDGEAEIKRLFVADEARGHGVGLRLIEALEAEAGAAGIRVLRLETGIHQPEAIGLYRKAGYRECEPFGPYAEAPDPLSIYMEKWPDQATADDSVSRK